MNTTQGFWKENRERGGLSSRQQGASPCSRTEGDEARASVYCPEGSDRWDGTRASNHPPLGGRLQAGGGKECCISGCPVCSMITEVRAKMSVSHGNRVHTRPSLGGGGH